MVATTIVTVVAGAQPQTTTRQSAPVPAAEAVLACGRRLFKRPVYVTADSKFMDIRFSCPSGTAAYVEAARRLDLRVVESEASVILVPEWRFTNPQFKCLWASAAVRPVVSQGSLAGPSGRELSAEELAAAAKAIVDLARTPPLGSLPSGTAGETLSEELDLEIVVLPLQKGVDSVVALWGHLDGWRRLVYGELRDGRYVFKWDSPILTGKSPTLNYADVDGDGAAEVAITSQWGRNGSMVSIFSMKGRELTRQTDCQTDWSERASDRAAVACPVVGAEVILEDAVMGERPLWVDDRADGFRMMLKNGRYVRTGR